MVEAEWTVAGNMMFEMFNQKSFESFYPLLCKMKQVRNGLENEYGESAKTIIEKISSCEKLSDSELAAEDIIQDMVKNSGIEVDALWGYSSADEDEFPISIMRFGSMFWIQAMEHDDIGYFSSAEEARSCAEFNYEPFITLLSEIRGS